MKNLWRDNLLKIEIKISYIYFKGFKRFFYFQIFENQVILTYLCTKLSLRFKKVI